MESPITRGSVRVTTVPGPSSPGSVELPKAAKPTLRRHSSRARALPRDQSDDAALLVEREADDDDGGSPAPHEGHGDPEVVHGLGSN